MTLSDLLTRINTYLATYGHRPEFIVLSDEEYLRFDQSLPLGDKKGLLFMGIPVFKKSTGLLSPD